MQYTCSNILSRYMNGCCKFSWHAKPVHYMQRNSTEVMGLCIQTGSRIKPTSHKTQSHRRLTSQLLMSISRKRNTPEKTNDVTWCCVTSPRQKERKPRCYGNWNLRSVDRFLSNFKISADFAVFVQAMWVKSNRARFGGRRRHNCSSWDSRNVPHDDVTTQNNFSREKEVRKSAQFPRCGLNNWETELLAVARLASRVVENRSRLSCERNLRRCRLRLTRRKLCERREMTAKTEVWFVQTSLKSSSAAASLSGVLLLNRWNELDQNIEEISLWLSEIGNDVWYRWQRSACRTGQIGKTSFLWALVHQN